MLIDDVDEKLGVLVHASFSHPLLEFDVSSQQLLRN